jgi:uncharacterized protein
MWSSTAGFALWLGLDLISLGSAAHVPDSARSVDPSTSAALTPRQPRSPNEALQTAVRAGDLDQVKRLLAAGADVNARDPLGSAPLLVASCSGKTEVAQVLLAMRADVNAARPDAPSSPLECAVLTGQAEIVKLLLASGAHVDTRSSNGQTVLHIAASRGNAQITDLLLGAHADVSLVDIEGNTALDAAVLHGRSQVVSLLIAHGADVMSVHVPDGRGPLHEACVKGFANLVPILTTAGADPSQRDRFGQSPLDLALAYKNGDVVTTLLHLSVRANEVQESAEQGMLSAIERGWTEIVHMLIESGFDIAKPTAAGSTYLHTAALKGQKKVVQLLLDYGASIEAIDRNGATPLHDAALGGNPEVIAVLLDRGAHVDAIEEGSGSTPLMLAAAMGRTHAVFLLLGRGANPAIKDHQGRTALDRAKETEDEDLVRLLSKARSRA